MLTLISFLVALAVLIAIHEYGHYRVAVACGVKVERFSIGFGPVVARWRPKRPRPGQHTEFVLSAIPLGGYVKMVDEQEGAVSEADLPHAFNRQPLSRRAAIVAAGPVANLLLAVVLYAVINWWGVVAVQPVIGTPPAQSLAAQAGLQAGDRVLGVVDGDDDTTVTPVESLGDVRWQVMQAAMKGQDLTLRVAKGAWGPTSEATRAPERDVTLPLAGLDLVKETDSAEMGRRIGLNAPFMPPVLGSIQSGGAADRAGLQKGDRVLRVGQIGINDAAQLRQLIRAANPGGGAQPWLIERQGRQLTVPVLPAMASEGEGASRQSVGRIGAVIGGQPPTVTVRQGLWGGLQKSVVQTWDIARLTVNLVGKMLVGQASIKHLSGPVTIAEQAGQSAQMGGLAFLSFLALLSVSLGVLNLLPLPVLDGGHLMYYLWEAITRRPVPPAWQNRLQRVGMMLVLALMSVAIFNDLSRHLN